MQRRQFLKNTLMGSLAFSALPSISYAQETDRYEKLVLLHTNDTHSRIEPFGSGKYKGLGGVSSRMKLIKEIREEEKNVLLLDAGDIFQGTPYFNLYNGEVEIKAMNMMGYDAATIGNHDFDAGIENLATQSELANFPFLISNYHFDDTPMAGKSKPYTILNKGKLKIGITGAGIELDGLVHKKLYGDTQYAHPVEKVQKIATILKEEEKCDLVILLSHLGYKYRSDKIVSDTSLAYLVDNVDIIIGGAYSYISELSRNCKKK